MERHLPKMILFVAGPKRALRPRNTASPPAAGEPAG
jgi:hypothetical protein